MFLVFLIIMSLCYCDIEFAFFFYGDGILILGLLNVIRYNISDIIIVLIIAIGDMQQIYIQYMNNIHYSNIYNI